MVERTPNQGAPNSEGPDQGNQGPGLLCTLTETTAATAELAPLLEWSVMDADEPHAITLSSDESEVQLRLTDQLRVLPDRRLVCGGWWLNAAAADQQVVVKWFFGDDAQRYADRERRGLAALVGAGVPTPALLAHFRVTSATAPKLDGVEANALVFERLVDALPFDDALLADHPSLWSVLWGLLARLHAAGVSHTDLHFGNLLYRASAATSRAADCNEGAPLWLIDGDGVRQTSDRALPLSTCVAAFTALAAQAQQALPIEALNDHWGSYSAARGWEGSQPGLSALERGYNEARRARVEHFQAKTQRTCTAFIKRRTIVGTALVDRGWLTEVTRAPAVEQNKKLRELLAWLDALPEHMLTPGVPLKAGNTATVMRVRFRDQALVVKRYNNKSWWHRVRRLVRPNRGLNSWVFAHTLGFMGIPTARAVALLRTRFGGPTYLVMQECLGTELNAAELEGNEPLCRRLVMLLDRLGAEGLVHNDTKASNFLWDKTSDTLTLIDLDAMQMPASANAKLSGQQRDRRRLLRNFAATPELQRRFRSALGL